MAAGRLGANLKSSGFTDLKYRLLFVLLAIVVFRIGSYIPVPGLNPARLQELFNAQQNNIVGLFNMFSGGALMRFSIFALGIMPYISASIIIQLLTVLSPQLSELRKEGESGQRKINKYTRYGTVILSAFQAIGISKMLVANHVAIAPGFAFYFTTTLTLVTGTMFLMWLGEQVTERGIGNGISMIIFAGIVAGLPSALGRTLEQVREGQLQVIVLLLILAAIVGVVAFVVYIERAQRRITINYARRMQGGKVYAAQSSHLPLKINMAGVIPPIFASSLILFPATIAQWFGNTKGLEWLSTLSVALQQGQPLHMLLFGAGIIFFCFFYTALVFNPKETAENLKKSGAFIPGIRPGEQTARYIDTVMTRLTLAGSIYVTLVCLLPEFLILAWNVPFYFGGTSLLIIVVVVMDFMAQVQAHIMSYQYESLLKKANLRGGSGLSSLR
ncbi:preprotein translocase subunit SecY [Aquicella lusitana]|uniref:Protein translocase subunit SecY n=1 Tax=Aquicella lusitana TaxID=254246 RepID=A0A370GTE1_9COXI|nr:preprotein translocase subunit SecY [Aquicella lusitana]RDI46958.1 protein translocase subunit secY/sec61 alpha [Aquicella lusitana]VVC73848.1 Protein translocase subunit SecY [Aquicella lusitana]